MAAKHSMSEGTQRRSAAIVSADVVEYSRLMGADEVAPLAALRAHRTELIDAKINQSLRSTTGFFREMMLLCCGYAYPTPARLNFRGLWMAGTEERM
jgi:hypothetical protein